MEEVKGLEVKGLYIAMLSDILKLASDPDDGWR